MDRESVDAFVKDGYDRLMLEGYSSLRQTVTEAAYIWGLDYPPIMVNMTELARQYDKEGHPRQALGVIKAALDTWSVIKRRHQVPIY